MKAARITLAERFTGVVFGDWDMRGMYRPLKSRLALVRQIARAVEAATGRHVERVYLYGPDGLWVVEPLPDHGTFRADLMIGS
jgi:hypothetical protein